LKTTFTQSKDGANIVFDTKYFDSKLGMKISLINKDGNVVSGTSLLGLYYEIDGTEYYPNIDGTTRIKIADKVGNVQTWLKINTANANIATGNYTLRIESYGSPDGIYYGLKSSSKLDIPLYIINEIYGLDITMNGKDLVVDGKTGKNLDNTNIEQFDINYNSGLTKPNLHMKLYRRDYSSEYSTSYNLVNLTDYVSTPLIKTKNDKEYLVVDNPNATSTLYLTMKDTLITGTYKLEFILYDDATPIGTVEKYIIIK
jgi:hypothetical protein